MPPRVIIAGLGAMGSSAAHHLARRGVQVLGFDRFRIPHHQGSHHGLTRMIRLIYSEHPGYVPLLRRAYELWADLEREAGEKLLHITGGVYFGRRDAEFSTGAVTSAKQHGLAHAVLDRAAIAARHPQFRVPDDFVALHDPAAGFLLSERCIAAHARLARAHGAELHEEEPILDWHADARGVRVTTARATYEADRLILTAGAWTPKLLLPLPDGSEGRGEGSAFSVSSAAKHTSVLPTLTVTRQTLCWVRPRNSAPLALGTLPVWAVTLDGSHVYYGFPICPAGGDGFKLALHAPGPPTDPDTLDRTPQPNDDAGIQSFLKSHIPDAAGPTIATRVCMYTSTPDQHFIIDRHRAHADTGNVIIASPCSGHGFKFSSVIGEVLADMATLANTRQDIAFLSLQSSALRRNSHSPGT